MPASAAGEFSATRSTCRAECVDPSPLASLPPLAPPACGCDSAWPMIQVSGRSFRASQGARPSASRVRSLIDGGSSKRQRVDATASDLLKEEDASVLAQKLVLRSNRQLDSVSSACCVSEAVDVAALSASSPRPAHPIRTIQLRDAQSMRYRLLSSSKSRFLSSLRLRLPSTACTTTSNSSTTSRSSTAPSRRGLRTGCATSSYIPTDRAPTSTPDSNAV